MIITATVEDKMQTVRLPLIEHEDAFWDFIEILFEELRCGMFYTREKRPAEPKSKKRRSSTETSLTPSLDSGAQKRQRVQVSLERMNLKKSLLSLGKERMVRNDDSTTAAAAATGANSSSSSSSPVHSPAAAPSVSPASSTASSRQDANRSTVDISVVDSCYRMSVRGKNIVFPELSSLGMILVLADSTYLQYVPVLRIHEI